MKTLKFNGVKKLTPKLKSKKSFFNLKVRIIRARWWTAIF